MTSKRAYKYNPFKRYCCVYGCLNKRKNNDSNITFFKIPDDIERRQEWLTAIEREDLLDEKKLNKAKKNFICSEHFDDSAVITSISRRLKSDAFPTKILPYKSEVTTENTSTKALPQTSKDLTSVSTYSHTSTQTNTQAQQKILQLKKELEHEIDKPNIDKSLNELKHKLTSPSEPTTSTSQCQTKESNLSNEKIMRVKLEITSTSTQTDFNGSSNKSTQTTLALTNKPRKRKLTK